ncbi:hypothetical protein K458DRAFT_330926 [Lentithecium fluviatile CBS 122367]|uniref:Rhodopsin domain-containing protein n=1 Tax=Lentithecium fluviatile CBS 122367 TaxID=1168545 RepID=A0A6G1JEH7_9PLEO|nr:hypothetical protein K458DRAFT_330926 [Lentithecium fluviatile CBS 122367]
MGNAGSVPATYDAPARGITVMLVVLTTLSMLSRTVSRRLQGASFGIDDGCVIIAYIINLGVLITALLEITLGAVDLPRLSKWTPDEKLYSKNLTLSFGILYTLAIIIVKISVLFLYRRIFTMNERWFRIGWWANFIILMPCYTVFTFTLTGLQVTRGLQFGHNDISRYAALVSGSINAVSDLLVLILPVGMVLRLMLPNREKAALLGIFSLGILATSISVMRTIRFQTKRDHHWNQAYSFYNDMISTSTESSTGLMCVCLTVIKPLLRKSRDLAVSSTRNLLSSASRSYRSKGRSTGSASIHSDNISLHSRKHKNDGITAIRQYDVQTKDLAKGITQTDVVLEDAHTWESVARHRGL